MITLAKDQTTFNDYEWAVETAGIYAPDELVTVYRIQDTEQKVAFYAQYISTGEYP